MNHSGITAGVGRSWVLGEESTDYTQNSNRASTHTHTLYYFLSKAVSFFKFHPYFSLLPSPITQRLYVLASNRTQHLLNLPLTPWRICVTSVSLVFHQYSMTQKRNYPNDVKLSSLISLSSDGDPRHHHVSLLRAECHHAFYLDTHACHKLVRQRNKMQKNWVNPSNTAEYFSFCRSENKTPQPESHANGPITAHLPNLMRTPTS